MVIGIRPNEPLIFCYYVRPNRGFRPAYRGFLSGLIRGLNSLRLAPLQTTYSLLLQGYYYYYRPSAPMFPFHLKLQGRDLLIKDVETTRVIAFKMKLLLLVGQLYKVDYTHFPCLAQYDATFVDTEECVSVLSSKREEFVTRFADVRSHSQELKIVSTPFGFPYVGATSDVQIDLIELQAPDTVVKVLVLYH